MSKYIRKKDPWALKVLEAMKAKANGLGLSGGQMMRTGGFKKTEWAGVWDASRIAAQTTTKGGEIYAYLFVDHGIIEADPRSIPSRKSGKGTIARNWSNKRLEQWREKRKKQISLVVGKPTGPGKEGQADFIIRQIVREELGLTPQNGLFGWHLQETLRLFQVEGTTSADRDEIATRYQQELVELYKIASAYSHSSEKRDEALKLAEVANK